MFYYQDRHVVLLLLLLAGPFLFSCEKEGELSQAVSEEQKEVSQRDSDSSEKLDAPGGGRGLCVCHGYTLEEKNGSYDCPPGDGCAKIVPCPCDDGGGVSGPIGEDAQVAFKSLDQAIEDDELPDFFKSGLWKEVFPFLEEGGEELEEFRNGDLTVLRLKNEDADRGPVHYAAVPTPAEDLGDPDDARFAVQVPSDLYEKE